MVDEVDILARTIYGEARGESIAGKVAVANVVLNRALKARKFKENKIAEGSHTFGNGTVSSACLRRLQFSCWNEKDPNYAKVQNVKATDLTFSECITIARLATAGLLVDNTHNSTHYHALSIGFPSSWKKFEDPDPSPAVIIGGHAFYNTVK